MRAAHLLAMVGVAAVGAGCGGGREAAPAGPPGKVQAIVPPPTGDAAAWIAAQVAAAPERQHVVYVGAAWCEPCGYFHRAVEAGELDAAFPRLTLLEFDADLDQARLEAAGYTSQMIPLFMRPAADGQASGRQIQGSIKGPGAVAEITPRLRRLIAD
ncbi:MAG: thioredoxin family protein [Ferruginibacter sp.]|jgi:hypothetical protein